MRKYITEKVGILESFQILFAIAILTLGYYAFFVDVAWNRKVDKKGVEMCQEINKKVHEISEEALQDTECVDIIRSKVIGECKKKIEDYYLNGADGPFKVKTKTHTTDEKETKRFIFQHMKRRQASEITFLVLSTLNNLFLIAHMILASFTSPVEFRTKWNAAIQGIVLFSAGFSAMLLSISTNTIDNKYVLLSNKYHICSILRFCDRSSSQHPEISQASETAVNQALDSFHACQVVKIKEVICILLIIVIGISIAMILLAMDLTTKYEQESEEEEIQIEETNIGNFDDDENLEFAILTDTYEDASGTEGTDPAVLLAKRVGQGHRRSSTTVLAEYLATHKEKSGAK